MIGQADALRMRDNINHWKYQNLDLSAVLYKEPADASVGLYQTEIQDQGLAEVLDWKLLNAAQPAILKKEKVIASFEIKNTNLGKGSKANHLAYVGDADVGERVNIGAGTITCNYDGVNKHRTTIEDDAFIGSDTQLVAPVRVGKGATLGAGTTLTRDAPAGQLTVSRAKQVTIEGWKRPVKKA